MCTLKSTKGLLKRSKGLDKLAACPFGWWPVFQVGVLGLSSCFHSLAVYIQWWKVCHFLFCQVDVHIWPSHTWGKSLEMRPWCGTGSWTPLSILTCSGILGKWCSRFLPWFAYSWITEVFLICYKLGRIQRMAFVLVLTQDDFPSIEWAHLVLLFACQAGDWWPSLFKPSFPMAQQLQVRTKPPEHLCSVGLDPKWFINLCRKWHLCPSVRWTVT